MLKRRARADIIDFLFQSFMKLFRLMAFPGVCNICGRLTLFVITDSNLRENVICLACRSFNRSRQMHYVFSTVKNCGDFRIWNMENCGSHHQKLLKRYGENYIYSAYFGNEVHSGQMINGVRHEDVRRTSFLSNYFDVVLSSDVLEHVSDPEDAFKEIARILKPGGKFIFTVPFLEHQQMNDRRAMEDEAGRVVFLKEPLYHGDPLRPEGILVFTIFGWDILEMAQRAGLHCEVQNLHVTWHGIIGPGAIVFTATKL